MNAKRLFLASRVALVVTAMSFALRAGAVGPWGAQFGLTNRADRRRQRRRVLGIHARDALRRPAVRRARPRTDRRPSPSSGTWRESSSRSSPGTTASLYLGTLIFGVANGSVEAACNPLITTLFPNDKTTKLNHFHVWFPGGIVIGGVLAYFMEKAGLRLEDSSSPRC